MKIILYTEDKETMGENLQDLIQHQLPTVQIDTMTSVGRLSSALCQPLNQISVVVIFVMCEKNIAPFFNLEPLFDNIRLILVLPGGTEETMAQWLQLNPSFISCTDRDFSDVLAVLEKIYTGQKRSCNDRRTC